MGDGAEAVGDGGGLAGQLTHAGLVALVGDGVGRALDEQAALGDPGVSEFAQGRIVGGVQGESQGLVVPSRLSGEDGLLAGRFGDRDGYPAGGGELPGAVGCRPAELRLVELDEDACRQEVGLCQQGEVVAVGLVPGGDQAWKA
ncbi:hypothetical protein ABZZ17_20020 [Streptomyces sp. NPDC006512]|uniref:hypothetical protein n=1 Tax=Streptomyces sp. NPDC006512 TaxID=3154307 RepID=UPI00339F830E